LSGKALMSYQIGDAKITKITETILESFTPSALLPDHNPDVWAEHPEWITSGMFSKSKGNILLSLHSWLVETPRHIILIDTGAGNDKDRPTMPVLDHLQEPYLGRLANAGIRPEAVDYVLLTHLHADHVGWNTRRSNRSWVPTFPNATYVFSELEQIYCAGLMAHDERVERARSQAGMGTPVRTPVAGVYADSVVPVMEAGLAKLIKIDGTEFLDGISFHLTAGHSINHASISLHSQGAEALFGGDVLHHPLEIYEPDLVSMFCEFPEYARTSRRWMLEYACRENVTYFSSHFPETSAGRITRRNGQFRWDFI
jgi:glyoxylase-like metal-dependent hydrolase (beta-lactamase superfamily II)